MKKGLYHMQIEVLNHPLIQHKVTLMRKKTDSKDFRELLEDYHAHGI